MLESSARDVSVLSLAGALPANELFPAAQLDRVMTRVMRERGSKALQYGWPEGSLPLRKQIARWMEGRGVTVAPEEILITAGAQQGLHLLAELLVPEGAPVAVETPTYTSALQALDLRGARLVGVPRTRDGIDLDALDEALGKQGAKVFYLVASSHNPTGGILTTKERDAVIARCERNGAWLVDDDAYGEMCYPDGPGDAQPRPLRAEGRYLEHIVHLGSFSKVLAPGLRVGWLAGPKGVIEEATRIKRAMDLETATLSQEVLAEWLKRGPLPRHIEKCRKLYRLRRDALVKALEERMPGEIRWASPRGGFSLLVELREGADAVALLGKGLKAGVAFEPAGPYFAGGHRTDVIRLSFSNLDEKLIPEAVGRLVGVLG